MADRDPFIEAQERVQKLSKRPSNEQLLQLYGLYKQATEGDVRGSRPGMLDLKGRAKYDAWRACEGTSQAAAKARYVSLVGELVKALG